MTKSKLENVKHFVKVTIAKSKDPQHNWGHLQRTANNAAKIVAILGVEKEIDVNLLLAACYLHDINRAYFSPTLINYLFETRNSKLILPRALDRLKIEKSERTIIEKAIYSSSFSFPFKRLSKNKDLYTQILQDADTLDFFSKEREISFNKAKRSIIFYTILGLVSNIALNYGRRNLKNYLNFPQLSNEQKL